jgi:hypothetical protein
MMHLKKKSLISLFVTYLLSTQCLAQDSLVLADLNRLSPENFEKIITIVAEGTSREEIKDLLSKYHSGTITSPELNRLNELSRQSIDKIINAAKPLLTQN